MIQFQLTLLRYNRDKVTCVHTNTNTSAVLYITYYQVTYKYIQDKVTVTKKVIKGLNNRKMAGRDMFRDIQMFIGKQARKKNLHSLLDSTLRS